MEVSFAGMFATRVPRRSTWTRSQTSITCGMECEISTTAMPLSRTRRMVSSTFFVWRTPSAAVGSSRKTRRPAQCTARAIAMAWR